MAGSYRNSLYNRPGAADSRGVQTTKRTWSNNGVHLTMETTTFSSAGSFGTFSTGTTGSFRGGSTTTPTNQNRSKGVVGAAFNLLGSVLSSQQQNQRARQGSKQAHIQEDIAYGDSEDEDEDRAPRPQGFMSKVADRLVNKDQRSRTTRSCERSPVNRAPKSSHIGGHSQSYRTEERKPSRANDRAASVDDTTDEEDLESDESDSEDSDASYEPPPRQAFTNNEAGLLHALASAVEHHRMEVRRCKRRLEQASGQRRANAAVLQGLVNELKQHEKAYAAAVTHLENAKAGRTGSTSQRRASYHSRPSRGRQPSMTTEHVFGGPTFEAFFGTGRSSHSPFDELDGFGSFASFGGPAFGPFEQIFNDTSFFGMPRRVFVNGQRARSGFSTTNARPQFKQTPPATTFSNPTPKPPPTLLTPDEVKKLFKLYNDRWNALTPIDSNIPFPCRGLQQSALCSRDTIWAPLVNAPVSAWSEETVMQANAQAFFLAVVGLTPHYTEAPGTRRIVMGCEKARASQDQLKELIDILKKEKTRWHSDRLGRRNGGATTGPNEKLQRDERARAVFHAVCELMEGLQ